MVKLSPSILSADFGNLERDILRLEKEGVTYVHIDVMDGNFVPNISIGIPVIESIRSKTKMIFDVHLMIDKPERYVVQFAKAGADIINIHLEATNEVRGTLEKIKSLGKLAGITIKPDTKVEDVLEYLEVVDLVLVMTVEPGFGGQKLMDKGLEKIKMLKKYIEENKLAVEVEVDGGVNLSNIKKVLDTGVDVIVAGSAIFENDEIEKNIKEFYKNV